tara:strand:- start:2721 stop:3797 length:1077 start_codon:yes stop_codon:yes gene_type:complete
MANQYTNDEWEQMIENVPTAPMTPPATTLNTDQPAWNQLVPATDNTQEDMTSIKDLFDKLTGLVTGQRDRRVATKTYVVELEKLINKLRECIEKLLALLKECKQNKLELANLKKTVSSHPNLNVIRKQLTNSITEMEQDQLDPDDFRRQLVDLVAEIKRICDAVEVMRQAGIDGDNPGDNPGGNPGDEESKTENPNLIETKGELLDETGINPEVVSGFKDTNKFIDSINRSATKPPSPPSMEELGEKGMKDRGSTISDGGQRRRIQAMQAEKEEKKKEQNKKGGWQTPEKLQSLSKSKPIRTLDSIKKKRGETKRKNKGTKHEKKKKTRGNRKKKKTRRNYRKKKKQTMRNKKQTMRR